MTNPATAPPVSCIMPTHDRRRFAQQAILYFLRQDYPNRELIVVDDGGDPVGDLAAGIAGVRYFRLDRRLTVGAKRNFACAQAAGDIVLHWDDDDWYSGSRISAQVSALLAGGAEVCGLSRVRYFDPAANRALEYRYPEGRRAWVAGNTLCYRKSLWRRRPFPEVNVGEDTRFIWQQGPIRLAVCPDDTVLVGIIHPHNVSPKRTSGPWWRERPFDEVRRLIGPDLPFYTSAAAPGETDRGRALVAAGAGIGDILRSTALVRALARLGYAVDMAIEPDFPETAQLLEGAPEIRRLYCRKARSAGPLNGLREQQYELAAFTPWNASLQPLVRARRLLRFDRSRWLAQGDTAEFERIAREAGWEGELPAPFAMASDRRFDLPADTIALHPGCKAAWPWKKWHGFDDLARALPNVALIGTPADLDNGRTYFRRPFQWPLNARDYIGALNLKDTAALLSQCAGLVSNDSGMMHLGAALGVPTWGIFGITSPEREGVRARNLIPISKGMACEPECRRKPWGRRDCERHLECLRTLTAADVLVRIERPIPTVLSRKEDRPMDELALAYHGNAFDASGYGAAARGYIHALHAAGVRVSVVDTAGHARQVPDPLVESLAVTAANPDFHLFHGIPPRWARDAFKTPNAIGMTVWETDSMPTQWAGPLNHVMEVWLPCEHNLSAFANRLARPLFKLPHVYMPRNVNGEADPACLDLDPEAFVVYSIFEWQDRKTPAGQIAAYLRAFPEAGPWTLVLKTNPGAASAAQKALAEARAQTRSDARVDLRCEAWDEQRIEALHRRGDCYLSLHRGEGWCYPLFEAACRGTPAVATAYSGPLEYLGADAHELVRYRLAPVSQRYIYYHPRMRWAEPDIDHAAERLRWVYENRDAARLRARTASTALRDRYSLEAVGSLAKNRLLALLERSNRARARTFRVNGGLGDLKPPVPIPGAWYDADYFENGVKSNWERGYRWQDFQKLFTETASFLAANFPGASSFLDAGCAKGFLVRALRALGKDAWGFDASLWAVSHAAPEAAPYLRLASVDEIVWDREFDLLVAMDLFAHLTEEQAVAFLERARAWTRCGMLAIIPTAFDANDRDLSHITRRDRGWWRDLILQAGWRQDPLHEAFEQVCQRHPLPSRMRWELFLYAPR